MKYPYGIGDFQKIATNDYFSIDRTDRIPMLENAGDCPLFIRPRRFGKSLMVSTLRQMADARDQAVRHGDELEKKFGNLRSRRFAVVSLGFERIGWEAVEGGVARRIPPRETGDVRTGDGD